MRPLTAGDAPWYLAHFSRPEIVHGSGFPGPGDLDAASAELRRFVLDPASAGTGMRWGMALHGDDALIGSIGYYGLADQPVRRAELGYDLAPEAWGRGLMAEALEAVVAHCFGELGVERLEATVLTHNARSMRTLERAGFRRERLLPEHGEDEHGVLCDEWLFALEARAFR